MNLSITHRQGIKIRLKNNIKISSETLAWFTKNSYLCANL